MNLEICLCYLCSYDFAFVDADKRNYQEYFELLLQLVSTCHHTIYYSLSNVPFIFLKGVHEIGWFHLHPSNGRDK